MCQLCVIVAGSCLSSANWSYFPFYHRVYRFWASFVAHGGELCWDGVTTNDPISYIFNNSVIVNNRTRLWCFYNSIKNQCLSFITRCGEGLSRILTYFSVYNLFPGSFQDYFCSYNFFFLCAVYLNGNICILFVTVFEI